MTKHTVIRVTQTSTVAPSQWEGETDKGEFVYARYRHGHMRVDIAPSEAAWLDQRAPGELAVFRKYFGHPLDGYLTFEELKEHTSGLIEWPESEDQP